MGRLLFESKGIAKKSKVVFMVCSIFMAFAGIIFMIFGYEKRSAGLKIVGIVMIVLGILTLINMLAMNRSYLNIYENGIRGLSVIGLVIIHLKKEYDLEYLDIQKVQLNRNQMYGDVITVWAHGECYGLLVEKDGARVVGMMMQGMTGTLSR